MKSYTDIEQSKKLAKILPIESADGTWKQHAICGAALNVPEEMQYIHQETPFKLYSGIGCPCWSLAALLGVLAKIASKIDDDGSAALSSFMGQWSVNMFDCPVEATDDYANPVDACVAMIEKLNELNLL